MWTEWSTAQIALVTSGISIVLAILNFGWNVWSKFLFPKPRLKVNVVFNNSDWAKLGVYPPVTLEVVNFGPSDCVIRGVCLPNKLFWGSKKSFWIATASGQLVSGGKSLGAESEWPRLLKTGEMCSVALEGSRIDTKGNRPAVSIGFIDTFDRYHLIDKKHFEKVRKKLNLSQ